MIELILGGPDAEYMEALAGRLAGIRSRDVAVNVFTDEAGLRAYLAEPRKGGGRRAAAVWEEFLYPGIAGDADHPVMVLCEAPGENCEDEADAGEYMRIARYRPVAAVCEDIGAALERAVFPQRGRKLKVITVCSSGGGSGCTTIAAALAQVFGSRGERVLFLDMAPLPGAGSIFGKSEAAKTFSNVIYHVKNESAGSSGRIRACALYSQTLGVWYYAAPNDFRDANELDADDCARMIGLIEATGEFDRVVADAGTNFGNAGIGLLKQSRAAAVVSAQRPDQAEKIGILLACMREEGIPVCIAVNEPCRDDARGMAAAGAAAGTGIGDTRHGDAPSMRIPYCPDAWQKAQYNPNSRLAAFAERLAQSLEEAR